MPSLPLPVRVAAGLAATAVEQTRRLPDQIVGLPITLASQALQLSMRVQQQVTELAIKGDDALGSLQSPEDDEEQPSWATFDEDEPPARPVSAFDRAGEEPRQKAGQGTTAQTATAQGTTAQNPTAQQVREPSPLRAERPAAVADAPPVENFDELTLPQVRGKLRSLTAAEVAELLDYEQAHAQRPEFLRMLSNRLERVRSAQ